jgi:ABC-type uncharacterized transport system permease subunit
LSPRLLDLLLFGSVLVCYFLASICYQLHVFAGHAGARRLAPILLGVGAALHTLALGEPWFNPAAPRLGVDGRMVLTIAWLIAVTQLLLDWKQGWPAIGALSAPIVFAAVFYGYVLARAQPFADPLARNPLMVTHLVVTILGFAAFALSFCMAVIYLAQSWLLQHKHLGGAFRRLPPLTTIAESAHLLATVGFTLLTLGVITGVLVAVRQGPGNWYVQLRFLTAFAAWGIYAVYLAASVLGGWRGRKTTYFLIGGFGMVLIAYFFNLR